MLSHLYGNILCSPAFTRNIISFSHYRIILVESSIVYATEMCSELMKQKCTTYLWLSAVWLDISDGLKIKFYVSLHCHSCQAPLILMHVLPCWCVMLVVCSNGLLHSTATIFTSPSISRLGCFTKTVDFHKVKCHQLSMGQSWLKVVICLWFADCID